MTLSPSPAPTPQPIMVRSATEADLTAINDIYNHYVLRCTCTYQEEPETIAGRLEWFHRHGPKHPAIVAEREGSVVGWGSLTPFHARSAYRNTVENSVYVHHAHHRCGIGALLLKELIARGRQAGHHTIIAAIDSGQEASVRLHTRFGFEKVGQFREVGRKFGRWLDVVYLQLLLQGGEERPSSEVTFSG